MGSFVTCVSQWMKTNYYGVFVRLSILLSRLMSVHEFLFRAGQCELEYSAARLIHICPQPARMGIDDRPTDRQPHSHPAGLRGVQSLENALEMLRINARP